MVSASGSSVHVYVVLGAQRSVVHSSVRSESCCACKIPMEPRRAMQSLFRSGARHPGLGEWGPRPRAGVWVPPPAGGAGGGGVVGLGWGPPPAVGRGSAHRPGVRGWGSGWAGSVSLAFMFLSMYVYVYVHVYVYVYVAVSVYVYV